MKFIIYKDKKGEFRWKLKASNNLIIADSGEGYKHRIDCYDAIKLIQETDLTTTTVDDSTFGDKA